LTKLLVSLNINWAYCH